MGFSKNISIEKGLVEYGNPLIAHNVEYTLHPVRSSFDFLVNPVKLPITAAKLGQIAPQLKTASIEVKNNCLLSAAHILRNACVIGERDGFLLVATIEKIFDDKALISVSEQYPKPFAMVECKRVGVEEGMKKGPQTIEKAKQGAYVAKAVSCLQKIRDNKGRLFGVISKPDGEFYAKPYAELVEEITHSKDASLYKDFILTVGVVSNHGNWFTSDNPNKEMLVLSQAYDWLLFLTDKGICEFIEKLLIKPEKKYEHIKKVFLASYQQTKNQFTKVQMEYEAHLLLLEYFRENKEEIEKWFNVVAPKKNLCALREQLRLLASKDWERTL
jgi:hypothetical protein